MKTRTLSKVWTLCSLFGAPCACTRPIFRSLFEIPKLLRYIWPKLVSFVSFVNKLGAWWEFRWSKPTEETNIEMSEPPEIFIAEGGECKPWEKGHENLVPCSQCSSTSVCNWAPLPGDLQLENRQNQAPGGEFSLSKFYSRAVTPLLTHDAKSSSLRAKLDREGLMTHVMTHAWHFPDEWLHKIFSRVRIKDRNVCAVCVKLERRELVSMSMAWW